MEENELNLQNTAVTISNLQRRRKLLPVWIIVFTWLFFLFAAAVPVALIFGLLHHNLQLSLFGIGTNDPFTLAGLFIIMIFGLKGIVSFGLWNEKKWGVKLAKIDAIVSIAICCIVMGYEIIMPNLHMFSFRLELIAIIPYYYKMQQIQYDWENFPDNIAIS